MGAASGGCFPVAVQGRLTVVASLVVEHGLIWASGVAAHGLLHTGSVVMMCGLSCSTVFGIFPDQRLNPCFLYRQVDSLPLSHQGSPLLASLKVRKQPQGGQ